MSVPQATDTPPLSDDAEEAPPAGRLAAITGYGLQRIPPDVLARAADRAGLMLLDARRLIAAIVDELEAV